MHRHRDTDGLHVAEFRGADAAGNRSSIYRHLWHHRHELLSYIRGATDGNVAEDVLSDVYLIAWRRRDAMPLDPGEARAWLFGVSRRVVANHRRSEGRKAALVERVRHHCSYNPVESTPTASRLMVAAAFNSLPMDDRYILWKAGIEGLTGSELAAHLGCSYQAAATRLSRARSRLLRAIAV